MCYLLQRPVTIVTLRDSGTGGHLAERTLQSFSDIHIKHNNMYKDAAEQILLVAGTTSLFVDDVGYHSECYKGFRSNK